MRKDISLDKKATHYCKHCGLTMRPDDLFECEACDGDLCEPRKKESIKRTRRKGAEVKPVDLYEVRFKSSKTPRSPGHPLDPSFYPFDTKVSSIWYTGSSYQVDCAGLPVFHLSRSDMGWLRQYVILPKATKVPNWGGMPVLSKIESIQVCDRYGWVIKYLDLKGRTKRKVTSAVKGTYLFVTVSDDLCEPRQPIYLVFSVPVVIDKT